MKFEWIADKSRLENIKTKVLWNYSRMKFSSPIRSFFMMIQVVGQYLFGYISNTLTTITYTKKMTVQITTMKLRIFLNQYTRISSFKTFHDITYVQLRWITYIWMYMIFTYNTFQYLNIQRITTLTNNFTTVFLYITLQSLIAIFGYPN
jgi:hypothetical protein